MTTVGGWAAGASRCPLPPSSSTSSPCTTLTTCCAGVSDFRTSCPTALTFTRSMKPRTTLKLTSASSSTTRTSRRASWMLSSLSRPWPPSRSKIVVSLALKESSMESPSLRNYAEHFNSGGVSGLRGGAQLADRLGGILGFEHGRARDENRRAMLGERPRMLDLHTAVDRDVDTPRAEHRADLPDLGIYGGDELLASEARVDRHHQHDVEIVLDPLERVRRRRGIQSGSRFHRPPAPRRQLADRRQRALQVRARFDVHGQHVGAARGELGEVLLRFDDHQVQVEWQACALADGVEDRKTQRDVGHEAPVHHVDVDLIRTRGFGARDLLGEDPEVGGQDRGSNLDHPRFL